MTRLLQISDLHFGTVDQDLLVPLSQAIAEAEPDLVVMAGDFVQRARDPQFKQAADFMNGLGCPWLGVPGNHDIPLYNIPLRLIDPFRTYRRWISDALQPSADLENVRVLGLNTTDPLAHQRGRVAESDVERIATAISSAGRRRIVVFAHHPFHQAPEVEKKLMVGASAALERWAECGPHIIMTGHLHQWLVEPFVSRKGANMTLQLHCGTGLSMRRRGHPNDFAIVDCADEGVDITRMVAERGKFSVAGSTQYEMSDQGWAKKPTRQLSAV